MGSLLSRVDYIEVLLSKSTLLTI